MKEPKIYKLIDKVLAGQASTEEIALVDAWYQSFENRVGITDTWKEEELDKAMHTSFATIKAAIPKS